MGYLISICICLLLVAPCMAETINVDANSSMDFNNIQAAINAAFDGDTVLVADGTYTGPGNWDIKLDGKLITLQSEDCVIDCNDPLGNPHYGLLINNPAPRFGPTSTIIKGITILNGNASNGAGIRCINGTIYILDCNILQCNAIDGGGIFVEDTATVKLFNCLIKNNEAQDNGGGIASKGNLLLDGCSILENTAKLGGGLYIYNVNESSSVVIVDCNISQNSAINRGGEAFGGGIYSYKTPLDIRKCNISKNFCSSASGGGLYLKDNKVAIYDTKINENYLKTVDEGVNYAGGAFYCKSVDLLLSRCAMIGNSAEKSSVALLNGGEPIFNNCLIAGNICTIENKYLPWPNTSPGCNAIYIFGSKMTFDNCTILGNDGYALFSVYTSLTTNIQNSIIRDNYSNSGMNQLIGPFDISNSNIQGANDYCPGNGNIDTDPCFVVSGYWDSNGTPADFNDDFWVGGDYHLNQDSPCIDTGGIWPGWSKIDIDGNPLVINGRIDMGAYETNYIQAEMKFTPQMLNCNSKGKYVKAHLTLPEGFLPEDVDVNEPAIAEPMGIDSEYIKVLGSHKGQVRLEICFDREAFCETITETGEIEITVIGSLTTSRYFYATDTIKIKP